MRDLERALTDIRAMRSQIARGTEFRGYGPAAFAATGVLALLAALAQPHLIENPATETVSYLGLWIATALVTAVIIGADVVTRSRRVHSGLADEMIQQAAERCFPPALPARSSPSSSCATRRRACGCCRGSGRSC